MNFWKRKIQLLFITKITFIGLVSCGSFERKIVAGSSVANDGSIIMKIHNNSRYSVAVMKDLDPLFMLSFKEELYQWRPSDKLAVNRGGYSPNTIIHPINFNDMLVIPSKGEHTYHWEFENWWFSKSRQQFNDILTSDYELDLSFLIHRIPEITTVIKNCSVVNEDE